MNDTLEQVIAEAMTLAPIPPGGTEAYRQCSPLLIRHLNDTLGADPDIDRLIGHNPLDVMHDNHKHHAAFMATVFDTGSYELLARTIPWVYRSYHARRFSHDYFPLALRTWVRAIEIHAPQGLDHILAVYRWMIDKHETMIALSLTEAGLNVPSFVGDDQMGVQQAFQAALLRGDHGACLAVARDAVKHHADIEAFYGRIIQPSMVNIGSLWERAVISVAQEHLASAIVSRVMATVGAMALNAEKNGLRALITAAPNEFHEIGAWMIADLLTCEGWDVRYLGANTPQQDLVDMVTDFKPHGLGISITMPFNIDKVRAIIGQVRNTPGIGDPTIVVGGGLFRTDMGLCRYLAADGCGSSLGEVRHLFRAAVTHV
jgi:methanogenic corrinoid protein MtbC1